MLLFPCNHSIFFLLVVFLLDPSTIRVVVSLLVSSTEIQSDSSLSSSSRTPTPIVHRQQHRTVRNSSMNNNDDNKNNNKHNNMYQQDGDEAKEIAQYLPYFPFKGIPRFYDIGGFLYEPNIFQKIITIFVNRYRTMDVDIIAGLDARGFILGPPIALQLQKPFIMMRKKGKMPNSISSTEYQTEYGQREGLTCQKDKIKVGQRVLIIDDLVATGGTLSSAISLVKMLGGIPMECACVVELKMFINPTIESGLPSRTKLFEELGHSNVPIWGLISEDILTNQATIDDTYIDDGEGH